jgi:hypothetical protein
VNRFCLCSLRPHFLDALYFAEQMMALFDEAFQEHTGPSIFEF